MKKELNLTAIKNFIYDNYKDELLDTIKKYPDEKHITIDYKELEEYNYDLADIIIEKPENIINIIQNIIHTEINTSKKNVNLNIRFENIPYTPLEDLLNDKIGQLIETEARVINLTGIRPIIKTAAFECRGCARLYYIEQDLTNKNIIFPSLCKECGGNKFRLLEDDSIYEDTRLLIVGGLNLTKSNNRRINVLLTDDLIYKARGGEHIKITGILKVSQDEKTGKSEYYIYANNIEPANNETIKLTDKDKKQLEELSKKKDIINKLGHSIAPDLILEDEIRTAMLCYIVKGIKPPENDTGIRERDYINIMIVTDPSAGKTQLGQAVINCCENGIMTSGASSTGVGLIGAVVHDKINGGYILEIGAIPLVNNGHCVIDEFDKLPKEEQNKLVNPMESGYELINKATINEAVECCTGLLLLANPTNGNFNIYKPIKEQINAPSYLFSRCDLVLAMQDEQDKEKDQQIVSAILNKFDNSYSEKIKNKEILENDTVKKYLKYASEFNPELSKEAKEYLKKYFIDLKHPDNPLESITLDTRYFLALIRFSGAIAKLRLKPVIEVEDCIIAIKIKEYSLKQFGYDPETDTIDISRLTGEPTRADERNRLKIMEIINEWMNDSSNLDYEYIPKSKLLELFIEDTGKSKDTFYNTYKQLKNAGDIKEKQKKVYIK